MAQAKSKNARSGRTVEVNYCACGGEVRMRTVFEKKLKHFAECTKCGKTARRPKDLK